MRGFALSSDMGKSRMTAGGQGGERQREASSAVSCSPAMESGLCDSFSSFVTVAPLCNGINKPGSVHTASARHELHISHAPECPAHREASPLHLVKCILCWCTYQPVMRHPPPMSSKQYSAVIYTLLIGLLPRPLVRSARSTASLSQTQGSAVQADE